MAGVARPAPGSSWKGAKRQSPLSFPPTPPPPPLEHPASARAPGSVPGRSGDRSGPAALRGTRSKGGERPVAGQLRRFSILPNLPVLLALFIYILKKEREKSHIYIYIYSGMSGNLSLAGGPKGGVAPCSPPAWWVPVGLPEWPGLTGAARPGAGHQAAGAGAVGARCRPAVRG